jgi:putative transposase
MPRRPRIDLAGIPQHVIQRGNNRQPCFTTPGDYLFYLQELRDAARRFECAIHAYVLMTNHVHMLVTPGVVGAVSHMMQALGRRYVAVYNARHGRTGTLWEGRFKAGLVDNERYLLTCYRYIELNPVRAGMVRQPDGYRWSSHVANGCGGVDALLTPHAAYLELGRTPASRQAGYRSMFADAIAEHDLRDIRAHVQQQRALGSLHFRNSVELETGRCASVRPRGRPSRGEKST